jgi:hypothetical protein
MCAGIFNAKEFPGAFQPQGTPTAIHSDIDVPIVVHLAHQRPFADPMALAS